MSEIREINDEKLIVPLWREAFGDSDGEICFFVRNVKNAQCIAMLDCNKAASMMYLVDCKVGGVCGKYVYAACTDTVVRSKGYMTALLEEAKKCCGSFLCLIPANENLISYYKKRGFSAQVDPAEISFEQTDEITEYLFDGCSLEQPIALVFSKNNNDAQRRKG